MIDVNGLQSLNIPLSAECIENVGSVYPLVPPGSTNYFRVETNEAMVLTHLVIDDRVVAL